MNDYNFGNYLCQLRTAKKLSQSELASKLGVTNKAVSKWETGAAYPSAKLIYPLAKELGVTVEQIYSAMCLDKKTKNKVRRFLDFIFGFKKLSFFLPIILALTMYIIFIIFGDIPDKITLMILAPLMSLVAFGGVYLIFFIQLKNPMCPNWFFDMVETMFFILSGIQAISLTVTFLFDVQKSFFIGLPVSYMILSVISLIHNKRPKM